MVDIDVEVVDFDDDEPREEGEDVFLPDGVTLAQGFEELGMYPIGQIFRFLPPGKRFLSPVTVQVRHDLELQNRVLPHLTTVDAFEF